MDPTRNFQQDDLPKEVTEGGRVEDSTMELWEFCKDKIQVSSVVDAILEWC